VAVIPTTNLNLSAVLRGEKKKTKKENKTEGGKWKGAKPNLNKKVKKNKFEGVKPKPKFQGK